MDMKTNWKALVLVGMLSSASTLAGFKLLNSGSERDVIIKESPSETLARFTSAGAPAGAPGDFVYAAEATTPTVVHIKSTMTRSSRGSQADIPDIFRDFFGDDFGGGSRGPQSSEASGSGVVISADGYIVTNNHVV